MLSTEIQIGEYKIGDEFPCLIIAEAGVNHNGNLELALELVRQAKMAGADCVKFQTFKAEAVVTESAPKAAYQLEVTSPEESQLAMLQKLELPTTYYKQIIALCEELNILFLSTPYNEEDADFLIELGVKGFKIASGQLVEPRFLAYLAKKGKPLILSTGMATLAEVYEAVEEIKEAGNNDLVVLQCTTNYPAAIEDANIRAMTSIRSSLKVMTGYSDHVPNNFACYAAVAMGARVIEKHFTLDKTMEGPDHSASLNPEEFTALVQGIRATEASLGSGLKSPSAAEQKNTVGMRRSIVLRHGLQCGAVLKNTDLTFKRPATGISPKIIQELIGRKIAQDLPKDHILQMEDIHW